MNKFKTVADAMRKGIRGRKQVKNKFLIWKNREKCTIGECCALGALAIGLVEDQCDLLPVFDSGGSPSDLGQFIARKTEFYLQEMYVENPVTHEVENLYDTVIDLNDNRDWSIGEIANWIETEPEEQQDPDYDDDDGDWYDDSDEYTDDDEDEAEDFSP